MERNVKTARDDHTKESEEVKPYPILLRPSGKDYLWGGEKLKELFHKGRYEDLEQMHPLAETWECSGHPDGSSWAVNGTLAGLSLADIVKRYPQWLGSKFKDADDFPILIKFIDAKSDLSVQVHPSDEYAQNVEHQPRGKTEMWYVLHAEPGSRLVWGFEHTVTPLVLREHINNGTLAGDLHYVPVHTGDVFLIEAGTVHALGSGIIVAEIQESSNLTYRLWDYGRLDKDGNLRPLHFNKACDVLNFSPIHNTRQKPRVVCYFYGCNREKLCRCQYFEVEKIGVSKGFSFTVGEGSFQVVLCVDGEGGLETDVENRPLRFSKGQCIFLPANLGRCHVIGSCQLLKVRC